MERNWNCELYVNGELVRYFENQDPCVNTEFMREHTLWNDIVACNYLFFPLGDTALEFEEYKNRFKEILGHEPKGAFKVNKKNYDKGIAYAISIGLIKPIL